MITTQLVLHRQDPSQLSLSIRAESLTEINAIHVRYGSEGNEEELLERLSLSLYKTRLIE